MSIKQSSHSSYDPHKKFYSINPSNNISHSHNNNHIDSTKSIPKASKNSLSCKDTPHSLQKLSISQQYQNSSENDSYSHLSQLSGIPDTHYYQELQSNNQIIINKVMRIEDIEGDLFFNKKLFIDVNGLRNGLRGKKDGFSFFGAIAHHKGKVVNDFVLNIEEDCANVDVYFLIYFDKSINKFTLKNVNKVNYSNISEVNLNEQMFIKEVNNYELYKINLIQFGENKAHFLYIELLCNAGIKVNVLNIVKHNEIEFTKMFTPNDTPINIGIKGSVQLSIKSKCCYLEFNSKKKKWVLINNIDDIWVACDKKVELETKRIFKLGENVFEISPEKK